MKKENEHIKQLSSNATPLTYSSQRVPISNPTEYSQTWKATVRNNKGNPTQMTVP